MTRRSSDLTGQQERGEGLQTVTHERIPYCAQNKGGMSMSPSQMESTTFIVDCWDINDKGARSLPKQVLPSLPYSKNALCRGASPLSIVWFGEMVEWKEGKRVVGWDECAWRNGAGPGGGSCGLEGGSFKAVSILDEGASSMFLAFW